MTEKAGDEKEMPSRGFAKLDVGIIDSTLWMKPHDALRVWICLLAKCDSYGIVRAAAPAIAHLCFVTLERFEEIIADFASPDEHSRSREGEGRRLQKIDGGWVIVNYLRYRDMMQRKAASHAERQSRYREKLKSRDALVTRSVTSDTEGEGEGEGEGESEKKSQKQKNPSPADARWRELVPAELAADIEFSRVFSAFLKERRKKSRGPYTDEGMTALGVRLSRWGLAIATAQVERSIGYQGVLDPAPQSGRRPDRPIRPKLDSAIDSGIVDV